MSTLTQKTYQSYFGKGASGPSIKEWFQSDEEPEKEAQEERVFGRKVKALQAAGLFEIKNESLARTNVYAMSRQWQWALEARKVVFEVEEESNSLEALFCELVSQWKESTKLTSSSSEIIMHPAYQRIIGLGPNVIPLVLKDLQENGGHWFWALQALTGENPVSSEDAGRIRKMTQLWLEWGQKKGLI